MGTFAIYYEPSAYTLSGKIMGRQSAGEAFIRAVANAAPPKLWCYGRSIETAKSLAQTLADRGARTGIAFVPFTAPQKLGEAGLLFRPDPGIGQDAWRRLNSADARDYSICGITHTISTHAVADGLIDLLLAPLESWDALICTSRPGRDAVRYVLEQQAEHLRERLGATRLTLPQLPVIPLGVHCADFVSSPEAKQKAREAIGIAPDEIAVLFAGRLVVHGKAYPLPMFLALEGAAAGRQVVLILAGKAPTEAVLQAILAEARTFCPSVRVVHVPGEDFALYRAAWIGSDIFTSFSDSIQETFGLTPIEAMAAGLPVVVSDWNGYKDTVRDGIDGFRIPTLTLPAGAGGEIAERYDIGIDDFDRFSGYATQLVAVSIPDAEKAFRRLIDDAALRAQMGEAGRRRARDMFDWSIIFDRYQDLWADLGERRRSDAKLYPPLSRRRRPSRPDPFSMFASYPTHAIDVRTSFRLCAGLNPDEAVARRDLATIRFATAMLPSAELIRTVTATLRSGAWLSLRVIAEAAVPHDVRTVAGALIWMSKVGVTEFRAAE